ncbi:hypothetical protein GCM10009562_07580 [Nocardioides aquaticus]
MRTVGAVVLERGDQVAQAPDRHVADLAQQAQQPEPGEVRLVVVGAGGAAQAPLGQEPLAQVVLDRADGDLGGPGQLAEGQGGGRGR